MTRGAPKLSIEAIKKLIANPRTPLQLKAFWKKKLKEMQKRRR